MKLKCDFEIMDIGEEFVSVPIGEGAKDCSGVFKLNKTGREIFELLKEDTSEEAIVDILTARYENDKETITDYVRQVIKTLCENGVIED